MIQWGTNGGLQGLADATGATYNASIEKWTEQEYKAQIDATGRSAAPGQGVRWLLDEYGEGNAEGEILGNAPPMGAVIGDQDVELTLKSYTGRSRTFRAQIRGVVISRGDAAAKAKVRFTWIRKSTPTTSWSN